MNKHRIYLHIASRRILYFCLMIMTLFALFFISSLYLIITQTEAMVYGVSGHGATALLDTDSTHKYLTLRCVGSRMYRGPFVIEFYTLMDTNERHEWIASFIPAESKVTSFYGHIPRELLGIVPDVVGVHEYDQYRLIGAVSIRRNYLWITIGITLSAGLYFACVSIFTLRQIHRFARGLCPKCVYPLLEGELVTCPECGLRILRESETTRDNPSSRG